MASPFPGMDPYLEGEFFQEFHETLAGAVRARLIPHLSSKYVALLAKRYVIDQSALGIVGLPMEREIYPDVHVVAPTRAPASLDVPGGQVGAQALSPTIELPSPMLDRVPVLSVEIRDVAERRLVTLIEILSPVNKRGEGVREYAERRIELMQTLTHLLEIDLLRGGTRIRLLGEPPPAPYYAYVSRYQRRPNTLVWAISLRDRLPIVPVPLLPPDPDVPLDLQAAVNDCFNLVGYERLLDYNNAPPSPEVNVDDARWVDERLRAAGWRK